MKKLLVLFMSIVLFITAFAVTACDKENSSEVTSSSENSSSIEESSSSGQISRVSKSATSDSTTGVGDSSAPPAVSNGEVISSSQGSASASGDSYTVTETPTEGLPENIASVVLAINKIGTISSGNYQLKKQFIELAESRYNALSEADKALVPNAEDLKNARKAYDGFVRSVVVVYIEEFKQAATLISDFSDEVSYKELVTDAENKYKAIDDGFKSEVSAEYEMLVAAKVHAEINLIPEVENVTGEYYIPVQKLQKKLNELTQNQKNAHKKFQQDLKKLENAVKKIMETMVERCYICQDSKSESDAKSSSSTKGDGKLDSWELANPKRRQDGTDGFFTQLNTSNGSNAVVGIAYSDAVNGNVTIKSVFQGGIYFNAPASGLLTIYTRQLKQFDYRVYVDGELVGHYLTDKNKSDDASFTFQIEVPRSGKVEIYASKDDTSVLTEDEKKSAGYIYAVKFLYSTL
ncbi:MAG: hypothetical protein ACI4M6_01495 [Christensenellaceae bacterium]